MQTSTQHGASSFGINEILTHETKNIVNKTKTDTMNVNSYSLWTSSKSPSNRKCARIELYGNGLAY